MNKVINIERGKERGFSYYYKRCLSLYNEFNNKYDSLQDNEQELNILINEFKPLFKNSMHNLLNVREDLNGLVNYNEYSYFEGKDINLRKIPINDYFDLSPELNNDFYVYDLESLKRVYDYIKKTKKATIGFIEIKNNKVIGHEGRHTTAILRIFKQKQRNIYLFEDKSDFKGNYKGVKKQY